MPHPTVPASRRCETAQPFPEPVKGDGASPGEAIGSPALPHWCQEGTCWGSGMLINLGLNCSPPAS